MKKVQITCEAADVLALEDLSVMQGDLKSLSTENYEKLKNQILTNGFSAPFLIWDDVPNSKYWILDGTQRDRTLLKMQAEGYEIPPLPVVWIHAKDRKEAAKKLLSFASQYGRVEGQGLYEFFSVEGIDWREGVQEFNFHELNFPDFAAEFYAETTVASDTSGSGANDDNIPPMPPKRVQPGEMWYLGDHRLLCADSRNPESLIEIIGGDRVDMVFTDPPYGIDLDTDYTALKSARVANKFDRVANDDKEFDPAFLLPLAPEVLIFGANYMTKFFDPNQGSWIVWDKRAENENLDKMYGSAFEMIWSKKRRKQELARVTWAGCFGHNAKDDGPKKVHPTMKPVKLIEWFFARIGAETVLDPFGGSGSTLIACQKLDRKCLMIEIDPRYCDTIINRWQQFSEKKAHRVDSAGEMVLWDET